MQYDNSTEEESFNISDSDYDIHAFANKQQRNVKGKIPAKASASPNTNYVRK
jgi:hypothetical protein